MQFRFHKYQEHKVILAWSRPRKFFRLMMWPLLPVVATAVWHWRHLISLVQNSAEADFKMVYFNADGRESTWQMERAVPCASAALGIEETTRF